MLPERPRILDPCASSPAIPQRGAEADAAATNATAEHHQQICPTCGNRLTGHRCKLICTHCGYYMSCADYY